jgi:hypothetical protein
MSLLKDKCQQEQASNGLVSAEVRHGRSKEPGQATNTRERLPTKHKDSRIPSAHNQSGSDVQKSWKASGEDVYLTYRDAGVQPETQVCGTSTIPLIVGVVDLPDLVLDPSIEDMQLDRREVQQDMCASSSDLQAVHCWTPLLVGGRRRGHGFTFTFAPVSGRRACDGRTNGGDTQIHRTFLLTHGTRRADRSSNIIHLWSDT